MSILAQTNQSNSTIRNLIPGSDYCVLITTIVDVGEGFIKSGAYPKNDFVTSKCVIHGYTVHVSVNVRDRRDTANWSGVKGEITYIQLVTVGGTVELSQVIFEKRKYSSHVRPRFHK